jgi:ZIP family zinc transporter
MLPETYVSVILLSIVSGSTTVIGVALALWFKKSVKLVVAGIGFSAGIMLAISFLELIPESIFATGKYSALFALVLGFLTLLVMHFIIPHTHFCNSGKKCSRIMTVGLCVTIGMILHDFPEGFAMANSFVYKPMLGILVALAIAIHNIPEEFALAMPLVITKKKWFLYKMALLSALAEPVGAVAGLIAVSISPALTPVFMAFAAGAMIFVSIDELYPMAQAYRMPKMFLTGIALSLAVYFALSYLLPH